MTANELRQKYLDFFKSKGHSVIPSASLIPENDPTVLFTTAGMHPLVPYLMGEKHPEGTRLTDAQKCVRTGDIDEVGDATHHTFFEMLGNWSLGDYFKKEAIEWSWEFLTEILKLDKNRIAVSVFAGDNDAPFDEEAFNLWKNLGMPEARIAKLPKKNNWWGPAGETGPCGTDTEMFYWTGDPEKIPESFNDDPEVSGWVEIWNDVFMQYNKTKDGRFEPLAQKNVDTGMGLERTLAVINNLNDNYRTELFWPIIKKIEELSGKKYEGNEKAFRIIADHLKAATMILGDDRGVAPSNTGQGYVLRRLIRRAVRYGKQLGITKNFTAEVAEEVIKIYQDVYSEVKKNEQFIKDELQKEEEKFDKVLKRKNTEIEIKEVLREPILWLDKETSAQVIAIPARDYKVNRDKEEVYKDFGREMFQVYQKTGYPLELVLEELKKDRYLSDFFIEIVTKSFQEEMKKHQDLSRTASAGMFKGGLADASEETKKLHTTAHLMLESLRRVLGPHVSQKGSNITAERLRFDFSHPEKMTAEQMQQVEDLVNEQIAKDLPVRCKEMPLEEAKKLGATGVFKHKYGEKVKVYSIGDFSKEICGGPHVEHTGELGKFKIIKEESSSAGIRRVKATLQITNPEYSGRIYESNHNIRIKSHGKN
ncbi:alanine--tRNA ligase [Candidatus Falkowbacteria bacterium CG10_big_fil_rev_8_21_14_0_10_43_11]|uniref:Alanine--tRNA ligase n=1 Tax=Candidatus Falkowbacteria bacterium CG10_big_fil_rev_8_21_14_0_10_43_11 TaxID=1974568 RepID=A0A2M6WM06_9BACT|nr:MAG: alanine--tRNA ligase [Candidatus Falkowbacteria bacterium CG10_big_fil_rev_8_21_14_0_10_43_11]